VIRYRIGLDVGSTTVKAFVVDAADDRVLWKDYQRHDSKQAEKVLEFLRRIEAEVPLADPSEARIFVTGSGGAGLAAHLGAKFVQEVNAVSLAVEKLYPDAGSVIELGGQDAKIIIFKEDPQTGRKKKFPSMNDKCAGGTGSVIDKINAKLHIPAKELCNMGYRGIKLHPVAGKCGVFAETDINGLQKQGVPPDELMASLFEAIVQQNLSVLTRGNTLRPKVLLLGGPNTYIRGMVEAWRVNIPKVWEERKVPLPDGVDPESLIVVPADAQYFAALGAVEFGREEAETVGVYKGSGPLRAYLEQGAAGRQKSKSSGRPLARSQEELDAFLDRYRPAPFTPARFAPGEVVRAFLGVDGGSTSTKAVLLSERKEVLAKAYGLSKGNPIEDTKARVAELRAYVEGQGATLEVLGVGTTGYAKDVLRDVLRADAAIVETVAHTESALHFYDDVDVVCDVGGQDIKIIVLKHRKVKDFKLNTQCSAGNGYFLQSTAAAFGVDVRDYAPTAFSAQEYPEFGYGCAVFMQSDIVDFQRQGWAPHEIMAGLAAVLPKNIWLYVSQIPNLAKLGRNFVLQGGTQHNLAAVKAQVDFIHSRFHDDSGVRPNVWVHAHCGESGAIGAALEAARRFAHGRRTEFIGLDAVARIGYRTTRNESTRCYFCKNKCLRTFIDVSLKQGEEPAGEGEPDPKAPVVPGKDLPADTRRLILATCEKGTVEDVDAMRKIKAGLDDAKRANPNLAAHASKRVWADFKPAIVAEPAPRHPILPAARRRKALVEARASIRVGIPRVLNAYSTTPFFTAYLGSLGIPYANFVFSDYTSETLYKEGAKRGSIDPCFPSKVAIAHVHNLVYRHHAKQPLSWILFPMIDSLPSPLTGTQASRACPTVTATPETVKAAFTKESDVFAEHGIRWVSPFVCFHDPALLARQMFETFGELIGLTARENERACAEGWKALRAFDQELRRMGRETLEQLEREGRLGIVLLGRPYHNDPGIHHEILDELQKHGYPILTQDSLPTDPDVLAPLFAADVAAGTVRDGLDVSDVWKNAYSENTNRKVWAAKFVARHKNLVALELSSFKCGHDAPIYSVVEEIVERSGTPFFAFKDIDENKPTGSIKIRVETIAYFLKRYRDDMMMRIHKERQIEERLQELERSLREGADRALEVA
jgi:activator of 2-hydroxyglutaryl-CoA dehydratase/predicted nucleotide-binding protein (sugar kinase/HSP70/actin superfamily)